MSLLISTRRTLLSASRFTPQSIAGLSGWWTSEAGITIVTGVSQWADQSGNGRTLAQATGSAQPTFSASSGPNGLPGLTFDGTSDVMTAAFTLPQPCTLYMLVKQVTWTLNDYLCDGNTHDAMAVYQDTTTPTINSFAGTAVGANANLAVGAWGVVCCVFNGASSINRVNNTTEVTGNAGAGTPGGITIGADGPSGALSFFANVVFSDVLLYSNANTLAQRDAVVAYLMKRGAV